MILHQKQGRVCIGALTALLGLGCLVAQLTANVPNLRNRFESLPKIVLSQTELDLGTVNPREDLCGYVLVGNDGAKRLIILPETGGCPCCGDDLPAPFIVAPNERRWMKVRGHSPLRGRFVIENVDYKTNDPNAPRFSVTLRGRFRS